MIRDRDCIYGVIVTRRLRAMGIRDKPIAPASPWQNGFVERLIRSIRRECVEHIIVLSEAHLRRILKSYARYFNETRTHLVLDKDAPVLARFSEPVWSGRAPSWADFTMSTSRFKFSVHTTIEQLEQAGLDATETKRLAAERKAALKAVSDQ